MKHLCISLALVLFAATAALGQQPAASTGDAPATKEEIQHLFDVMQIHQQMRQVIKIFRTQRGRILSAILAGGQSDSDLIGAFRERFLWPRRREAYTTLRRGILRGELRKDVDMDLLLDSLYGPIYMRFLIRHDKLSSDFVDRLCKLVLAGVRP